MTLAVDDVIPGYWLPGRQIPSTRVEVNIMKAYRVESTVQKIYSISHASQTNHGPLKIQHLSTLM